MNPPNNQNVTENIASQFNETNWQQIAKDAYLLGRSGADCCVMWHSTLNEINYKSWPRKELSSLAILAEKYKGMRWDKVAKELGSHRRPIICLQVWQRSLNPILVSNNWNKSEDKKLLNIIETQQQNWVDISKKLSSAR